MLTENCIYVYCLIIFLASIHNIKISKTIYIYTSLARVREAQFLILDFLFERNEQYILINNISLRGIVKFKRATPQNHYPVTFYGDLIILIFTFIVYIFNLIFNFINISTISFLHLS